MTTKLPTPFQADDLLQGQGATNLQVLQEAINMSLQLAQETSPSGLEVRLHSNKVTILSQPASQPGGDPLFELPLLLAHVCASQDRLAIAPTTMGKLVDVWVLHVHGGDLEMEKVLRTLAKCGAIRYDLPAMYVLGSRLSAGTMFSIYRAQLHGTAEEPSEANVAIKVVPRSSAAGMQKRLAREVELHHACHNHVSINKLIATFQVEEPPLGPCCAMAMPLPSQDLMECVLSSSSEMMAANFMKGLLGALQHLHKQEIIYRKLSPESVFLTTDMKPLLSDFSLAMRLSELKRFPIQLGYPGYTAPEILLNMEPTMQSDIFSAGAVLFFMIVKQQPFADPDVATAISNNITHKIPLEHDELKNSPKLKDLLEGLMERSPVSRLDATSALAHDFVQQAVPVPHAPPGDPNARSQRLRQRFVKMLPGESSPAATEGEDNSTQEVSPPKGAVESDWKLSFSEYGRHEALVYRRRYLFSSGTTKIFLQIIPFSEIKDLQETSHTIWQTLELDGCLQVPLDGPDTTTEPYSPAMLPLEPAHLAAMMGQSALKPQNERITTGMLRAPELPLPMHRANSNGSAKKLRIDSASLSPAARGQYEGDDSSGARGQPTWWMQSQQAQLKNPGEKVSRDMFGTCAFSQTNEDGQRRRFVKKLGMGEEAEEDFDDTASWQSWRSEAVLSSASRNSRGRSGSMASCISNASAAAMRELLLAQSEDESDRDFDGFGPPAGPMLSHRGSGIRGSSPHLTVPSEGSRRQILSPTLPAPPPQRDWGTCQFKKEVGPGGRGRQKARSW
eukprot:s5015_g1.t1